MPPVIRPFSPPVLTQAAASGPAKPAAQARAAQQAFFRQALGDPTPVRGAPAPAAAPAAAPPQQLEAAHRVDSAPAMGRIRPLPDTKPERILRPGSFVDIKI